MYRTVSKEKNRRWVLASARIHPHPTPTLPKHPVTIDLVSHLIDQFDEYLENLMTDYHKAWNKREQLHKLYIRLKEDD